MGAAEAKAAILANKTALGIEFGSTRIKAVLVDDKNQPIASGAHEWENRYENGVWTYSLEDIWTGIQDCYQDMAKDVKAKYDGEYVEKMSLLFDIKCFFLTILKVLKKDGVVEGRLEK